MRRSLRVWSSVAMGWRKATVNAKDPAIGKTGAVEEGLVIFTVAPAGKKALMKRSVQRPAACVTCRLSRLPLVMLMQAG